MAILQKRNRPWKLGETISACLWKWKTIFPLQIETTVHTCICVFHHMCVKFVHQLYHVHVCIWVCIMSSVCMYLLFRPCFLQQHVHIMLQAVFKSLICSRCLCVHIYLYVYIRIRKRIHNERIMWCASLIYAAEAWGRRMLAANYNTRAAFISVVIIIIITIVTIVTIVIISHNRIWIHHFIAIICFRVAIIQVEWTNKLGMLVIAWWETMKKKLPDADQCYECCSLISGEEDDKGNSSSSAPSFLNPNGWEWAAMTLSTRWTLTFIRSLRGWWWGGWWWQWCWMTH